MTSIQPRNDKECIKLKEIPIGATFLLPPGGKIVENAPASFEHNGNFWLVVKWCDMWWKLRSQDIRHANH